MSQPVLFAALPSALFVAVLTYPAVAWKFTPKPVCTLSDVAASASVKVTYDPREPEPYAISVTSAAPWPGTPVFSMRFDGPRGMTISTTHQKLSNGDRTLTVTDTGFDNVLNGLEFNNTATALAGTTAIPFLLDGVAPEMKAFRACVAAPLA